MRITKTYLLLAVLAAAGPVPADEPRPTAPVHSAGAVQPAGAEFDKLKLELQGALARASTNAAAATALARLRLDLKDVLVQTAADNPGARSQTPQLLADAGAAAPNDNTASPTSPA